MKKTILLLICGLAFAFNVNGNYKCLTFGVSIKRSNGEVESIKNTPKTQALLKKSLKYLYEIKLKPLKDGLIMYVDGKEEKLQFVKEIEKGVKLYKDAKSGALFATDSLHMQAGLNIPAKGMVIFYNCK